MYCNPLAMFSYSPQGEQNIIRSKLRWRLKHAADLLEALACDGRTLAATQDATPSYSGPDYVDMAPGQIGVPGGAWQTNVDARVKLRKAAIQEVAKIRKLLAEPDSASAGAGWKPPRPVKRMPKSPPSRL
jgi:hypothetical protein